MGIFDIVINCCIFFGIAVLVIFACTMEIREIRCPQGCSQQNRSECGESNGKIYSSWKAKDTDDEETALKNIKIINKNFIEHEIMWRRFMIFSSIISAFYFLFIRRIPQYHEFLFLMFSCYLVMYMGNSFFKCHHYRGYSSAIEGNLKIIKRKLTFSKDNITPNNEISQEEDAEYPTPILRDESLPAHHK